MRIFKTTSVFIIFLFILSSKAPAQELPDEVLTWQGCVKEAQKNHPDLIFAEESVKQSEAGKKITASSFFPQIDGSLGASTSKTESTSSGVTTKRTTQTYNYGASAEQLIFDARKTGNNVRQASENIKAAQYNYRFTSTEVRLRLRSAFVNLLKAQELLNITEDIFKIRRGNLELITLRYESGLEHKGALLNARANLAQAELEIIQAKRAVGVAQRQLIKEMGRGKFSQVKAEGDFKVNNPEAEKPDFEVLAKNNPSLNRLNAQTNAAAFGIKSAQADFFPKLSAQGGASRSSSKWPPEDDQLSAGLTLTLPLFEGGLRSAQVAQARAQYNQAVENARSARDGVIVTLEQSWVNFQDALGEVEAQNKFLIAAEARAEIAEAQYSLGLIQFDNWIIIEDNLVSNKKALLNAQANLLLAEASWIQAKGETLEYAD